MKILKCLKLKAFEDIENQWFKIRTRSKASQATTKKYK